MSLELPPISRRFLTQVMRRVLDLDTPRLLEISAEPLGFEVINPTTAGLFRIHGRAGEGRISYPWSCVLKVLQAPPGAQRPEDWAYWKREALVYASHLLQDLPTGVRGPRIHGVHFNGTRQALIFMEELAASHAVTTRADLETATRALGRLNGRFLGRPPTPRRAPFLSRAFLRSAELSVSPSASVLTDPTSWLTPGLKRALPRSLPGRLQRIWERRGALLDQLDLAPQTLCHLDAYSPNLFVSGAETVFIDWAFVGRGALGMDLGQLIANTFTWLLQPPRVFSRFIAEALASYRRGLKDVGSRAAPRSLEATVGISAALRTVLFAPFLIGVLSDRQRHSYWRSKFPGPMHQTVRQWGRATDLLLALADP